MDSFIDYSNGDIAEILPAGDAKVNSDYPTETQ